MIAAGSNGEVASRTPGEVAEAMTGRDYLSWSQVTTYQACSLKWAYTYVEQAPREVISSALLLGSGVHASIEQHLHAQMTADPTPTIDTLMDVFQQSWQQDAGDIPVQYSRGETAASQADTAKRMLEAYLGSEHAQVRGQLIGIEEQLRTTLAADLRDLVAVVDKIELRDRELVISDYKTARSGWSPSTAEDRGEQLVLYGQAAQAIADDLDAKVRLEFVVITKAKSPKVEAINVAYEPHRVERSLRVMRQVFRSMRTGVVYPSPSAMNCCTCPYQRRCSAWHQV